MKIDIHAHTSTHPMKGLHTSDASLDALEREARKHGCDTVVLMATYFPLKGTGLHNRELLRGIAQRPFFRMFGSLDLTASIADGVCELDELARAGVLAGIKLYAGYQHVAVSSEKVFPVYELARRYQLPVAIHGGDVHYCCTKEMRARGEGKCGQPCRLDEQAHLARPSMMRVAAQSFPDVQFILCHLGNPYFTEARELMRDHPNVVTDISGQFASGTSEASDEEKRLVRKEILKFLELPRGEERVLFGTDFPIQSYGDSVELVEQLGVSEDTKRAIYGQNAQRILKKTSQEV